MSHPEKADPAEFFLGLEKASANTDPDAEAEQNDWAMRLAPLDEGISDTLPAHMWAEIDARLEQQDEFPGITTIIASAGIWESLHSGIVRKIVHLDVERGTLCYFLKLDEGAVLPGHGHSGDEHCVVLEGELRLGDTVFGTGSYQLARTGVHHPPIVALTPALVYVQGPVLLCE